MKDNDRPEPPYVGDERATLLGFLDFHRATLQWKCDGLSAEQLARRATPPSTMSLLGLVRHLAEVERVWFHRVEGRPRELIYSSADDRDADFDGAVADQAAVDEAFATWRREVDRGREICADADLDSTFEHEREGTLSVRWLLVHLIEEYARHNGHADLLREAVDGATGE